MPRTEERPLTRVRARSTPVCDAAESFAGRCRSAGIATRPRRRPGPWSGVERGRLLDAHLAAELGMRPLPPLVLQAGHVGEAVSLDEHVARADRLSEGDGAGLVGPALAVSRLRGKGGVGRNGRGDAEGESEQARCIQRAHLPTLRQKNAGLEWRPGSQLSPQPLRVDGERLADVLEAEQAGSVLVHDPGDGFTSCAKSPASPRLVLGCTDRVFQHRAHEMVLRLPGPVGREDCVVVCRHLQVRLPIRQVLRPPWSRPSGATAGFGCEPPVLYEGYGWEGMVREDRCLAKGRGRIISRAPAQPQIARSRPQVPGCGPTRPRRQGRAWWGAPASTRLVTLARRVPLRQ